MIIDPYQVLILLTCIIILSYLYDLIAIRFKLPSVLLLLASGILLRLLSNYFHIPMPNTKPVLELLGIIGLVLIVLEGSLDLKLDPGRKKLIRTSFLTALFTLLLTSLCIATLINYWTEVPFRNAFINAIPLGVISSAIAIPSVARLAKEKKEFLVYESTFSDILGIILFNFMIRNPEVDTEAVIFFGTSLIFIIAISIGCVLVLLLLIDRIKHHTKFFLILAVLFLVYSIGKIMHLSSLVLVLAFGLALNNLELFIKGKLAAYFALDKIKKELALVKIFTAESAFLIRTFFFVLFGFSIVLTDFNDLDIWTLGMLIFTIILLIRFLYLHFIARTDIIPALFVAPRGLITILLFYSIPTELLIPGFSHNILFLVIMLTALLMLLGLQLDFTTPSARKHQIN